MEPDIAQTTPFPHLPHLPCLGQWSGVGSHPTWRDLAAAAPRSSDLPLPAPPSLPCHPLTLFPRQEPGDMGHPHLALPDSVPAPTPPLPAWAWRQADPTDLLPPLWDYPDLPPPLDLDAPCLQLPGKGGGTDLPYYPTPTILIPSFACFQIGGGLAQCPSLPSSQVVNRWWWVLLPCLTCAWNTCGWRLPYLAQTGTDGDELPSGRGSPALPTSLPARLGMTLYNSATWAG